MSAVAATGAPITFIGTGEHFDDLEVSHPVFISLHGGTTSTIGTSACCMIQYSRFPPLVSFPLFPRVIRPSLSYFFTHPNRSFNSCYSNVVLPLAISRCLSLPITRSRLFIVCIAGGGDTPGAFFYSNVQVFQIFFDVSDMMRMRIILYINERLNKRDPSSYL